MFQFMKSLSQSASVAVQFLLDRVDIPPFRGISGTPLATDAVTGASRPASNNPDADDDSFIKQRSEFLATLSLGTLGFTGYYSNESDYIGRLVGVSINQDFAQKNRNLELRVAYLNDTAMTTGRDSTLAKFLPQCVVASSLVTLPSLSRSILSKNALSFASSSVDLSLIHI